MLMLDRVGGQRRHGELEDHVMAERLSGSSAVGAGGAGTRGSRMP